MSIPQKLVSLFDNPDQFLSPSVYNNVFSPASGPYQNVIRITPRLSNNHIQGLLINPLKFNINAKWETLGMLETITNNKLLKGFYDYYTTITGMAGYADPTNLGLSSEKIYKNSDYLEFSANFRVIDWQGTNEPIKTAFILASTCLPVAKEGMNLSQLVDNIVNKLALSTVEGFIKFVTNNANDITKDKATDIFNTVSKTTNGVKDFILNSSGKLLEGVTKMLPPEARKVTDMVEDPYFFILASSPVPISVQVGTYFSHDDIVVLSTNITLSEQCSEVGPLYADFDMSFSSRRALVIGDGNNLLGFKEGNKRRVSRSVKTKLNSQINRAYGIK